MSATSQSASRSAHRPMPPMPSVRSASASPVEGVTPYSFEGAAATPASAEFSSPSILTADDEMDRASAQLAAVFPSFFSVMHGAAPSTGPLAQDVDLEMEMAEIVEEPESSELWQQGWQAGHAQGREEGLLAAQDAVVAADRESSDEATERARQELLHAVEVFHGERERYFHDLEQEAVRLSLAIAARILRREAQMDPLLLSGAVRVALGQLGESTTVRLIVPDADRALWEESLRLMPGLRLRPEVVGDARMELGECRIQTDFGGADLSLHEQLREIERGFFDRVPQRAMATDPVVAPTTPDPVPEAAGVPR